MFIRETVRGFLGLFFNKSPEQARQDRLLEAGTHIAVDHTRLFALVSHISNSYGKNREKDLQTEIHGRFATLIDIMEDVAAGKENMQAIISVGQRMNYFALEILHGPEDGQAILPLHALQVMKSDASMALPTIADLHMKTGSRTQDPAPYSDDGKIRPLFSNVSARAKGRENAQAIREFADKFAIFAEEIAPALERYRIEQIVNPGRYGSPHLER